MQSKMNPRVKKLWCEALRSDDYEQNYRKDVDGYIPLRTSDNKWSPFGVLCNIHAHEHVDIVEDQYDPEEYFDAKYFLPTEVKIWAGHVSNYNFKFDSAFDWYGKKMYNIEELFLNGVPFFVIADVIEVKF